MSNAANNTPIKLNISGLIKRETPPPQEEEEEEVLEPTEITTTGVQEPLHEKDFKEIRNNLQKVIDTALVAVEEMAVISAQSQHFKNYEALSMLLKTTTDASTTLLELHQKLDKIASNKIKAERESKQNEKVGRTGNTNILVVGTTKELLEMLNKVKEEEKADV